MGRREPQLRFPPFLLFRALIFSRSSRPCIFGTAVHDALCSSLCLGTCVRGNPSTGYLSFSHFLAHVSKSLFPFHLACYQDDYLTLAPAIYPTTDMLLEIGGG